MNHHGLRPVRFVDPGPRHSWTDRMREMGRDRQNAARLALSIDWRLTTWSQATELHVSRLGTAKQDGRVEVVTMAHCDRLVTA
jgi:hypothetical protein